MVQFKGYGGSNIVPNMVDPITLWLFNIAMEAMAHRNRWFA